MSSSLSRCSALACAPACHNRRRRGWARAFGRRDRGIPKGDRRRLSKSRREYGRRLCAARQNGGGEIRSGGSRDGGSASARVLHQAPDQPADALVRAMGRHRTAGAGSGSSRTPLIHPAPFRAPRILLVVIGRRSASASASPSRGPGNGILRAETGGRFQAQNAGERSEFGPQPQHPSLTDRNCEGFCRPGNRGGLPGLGFEPRAILSRKVSIVLPGATPREMYATSRSARKCRHRCSARSFRCSDAPRAAARHAGCNRSDRCGG